jgi:hypothetical protein
MVIGLIPPALEVMEGGVELSEIPPYIEGCILIIMTAVMVTAAVKMTERAIEW